MTPATGNTTESARAAPEDNRANSVDADIVRDISPRGLEILESLNTVFDNFVIEEK